MSVSLHLEEGKARKLSRELRDGGENSVSKIFRRCSSCFVVGCIKNIARILFWSLIIIVGYLLLGILKLIDYATKKKGGYLVLCVIAILFDPLFFYIPVIYDQKKCIQFDKGVAITATVLRSVFDFLKTIHIFSELPTELGKKGWKKMLTELRKYGWKHLVKEIPENGRKRLWLLFTIDILAILPIPQVLVIFRVRGWQFLLAMGFLPLQYLLRIIRTYFLFTNRATRIFAGVTLAIAGFNLLLFMHGGFVFGALWYFYAVEKVTACWLEACINHTECRHSSFHCDDSSQDHDFINDFCGIKTPNTTNYNFGLFNDALQSGIVEVTYFPTKLFHCLRWGLQNLSAFGQNLETSTDIWENIFAICMTSYGVVLFVFLIVKMQSDIARSEMIKLKLQEITISPFPDHLSHDVQKQIREHKGQKWQEVKPLDVVSLVNDVPKDIGRKIKQEIGLHLLEKVINPGRISELKSLKDLCGCLKPVSFTERTHILRKGQPIYEMLFVIKGKLWAYTSRSDKKNYLKDGDFCGEELITWTREESSSDLPISTRNVQAVTKVDAFVLFVTDLKQYVSLFKDSVLQKTDETKDRAAQFIQLLWRFKRILLKRKALTLTKKLSSKLKRVSQDELSKCWK